MTQSVTNFSLETIEGMRRTRNYYSESIIAKVVLTDDLEATYNHRFQDNGVPLPATFLLDMSENLATSDFQFTLTSPYPFKNREGKTKQFPLLRCSGAIAIVAKGQQLTAEELGSWIAEAKSKAKKSPQGLVMDTVQDRIS